MIAGTKAETVTAITEKIPLKKAKSSCRNSPWYGRKYGTNCQEVFS